MKKLFLIAALILLMVTACETTPQKKDNAASNPNAQIEENTNTVFPEVITVKNIAQNPEGIEYNKKDKSFFLSSLNAGPIIKVNLDGTYKPFTSKEPYPLSTAGLQIDYKHNRLLATGFNGLELFDEDPATKGISNLRIYNLETGVMENDINLSSLYPEAKAYFANDIAVDNEGNVYITDWYARVIYKVDLNGNASLFWKNETEIPSGPNGLDFHPDGYLLVSILSVNGQGLYSDYGLVKIPVKNPQSSSIVNISNSGFTGFDGMVMTSNGNVIGITNNGKSPGGNTLIELAGKNDWKSAEVLHSKSITPSTTVAVTPAKMNFVINQDFSSNTKEIWTIERIKF